MEPEYSSNFVQRPIPLFPAYTSETQNEGEKKDWLCNNSFTQSAFQQVSDIFKHRNAEEKQKEPEKISSSSIEEIVFKPTEKIKPYKRKKYDPSRFAVTESESVISQLKKKTFIEETGLSFERAFQTDARRDAENLMFECFERTKIANYHVRLKFPLGLSAEEFSFWTLSVPKKKMKVPERYFSKRFLKSLKNSTSEEVYTTKESLNLQHIEYIPVSVTKSNIFQSVHTGLAPEFLNVSSSWKTEKSQKEKTTSDEISSDSLSGIYMREKVIFYNKKVSEDPSNIDMWLEFVNFQDKIAMEDQDFDKRSNINSENIVLEKKIAILEKALKYNPKDISLNITKLKLSQNVYDTDKLIFMWENLIFLNPNDPQVWQGYLLFVISNLTTFNTSSILKLYNKCLKTLSNICEGASESHTTLHDIMPNVLGIFNQLCSILKSCGYTEKAIALYQALIEFNLFCEASVKVIPVTERIAFFEPFWDSGAQRIGEKNAIGWAATMQKKKILFDHISTDSDLNNLEDDILYKRLPMSETWLEFERLREIHHWLPWRPNPEYDQTSDDIDDIDRTVSFDDVSKFLFSVHEESHKFLLVLDFIAFLGFDIHLFGCHNMKNRAASNSISVDNYESISKQLKTSKLINPQKNPLCFDINMWNTEIFLFVDNILSQVYDQFSEKYKTLNTYIWIKFRKFYAMEVKNRNKDDVKNLRKFVKDILKKPENRNSLILWLEYISIEWQIDPPSSTKTFHKLFISSTSALSTGSIQLEELLYFVQYFLDLCVVSDTSYSSNLMSSREIQWILFHVANKENYVPFSNQEITPTMILKTISAFKNLLEKELNKLSTLQNIFCYCIDPYSYSVVSCSKCFAYFHYFSANFDASLQVYENAISFVGSSIKENWGQYIKEQLCIAEAELLNHYTWNSNASIKPLQTFLCESVIKYPYNSKLLYLLVKVKNAASVISPTRRFLAQILKNYHTSQPVTWIFSLAAEFAICHSLLLQMDFENQKQSLDDYVSSLGINWKIQSLYEKMLKSDLCAHVPILWRSYLKFEVMNQNTEKAKSIFHRALQICGWSKELLMDGITYFPDQLKQILAFMTEKQIRIHTPLEEVTLLMEHAVDA